MKKSRKDAVREDRIRNEAIVDAGEEEQALSWYYYLDNKIRFPFQAKCLAVKVVSLLKRVKPWRSSAWHRRTSASTTCSSWSDGRAESRPSLYLN